MSHCVDLDILCDEHIPSVKLSPLLQAIETSKATPISNLLLYLC